MIGFPNMAEDMHILFNLHIFPYTISETIQRQNLKKYQLEFYNTYSVYLVLRNHCNWPRCVLAKIIGRVLVVSSQKDTNDQT